jgi:hypothetical protein
MNRLKAVSGLVLIGTGIYLLTVNAWYSFLGLIVILSGFGILIYNNEKPKETKAFIKGSENYNKNSNGYNNVIKSSETKENRIIIIQGDTKTTIAIPSGLKKYLDENKNGKETYGEELARLLNEH